jgi:N6-adenosine-specific RNA methylase IME4
MTLDPVHFPDRRYDVMLLDPPWAYTGSPTKWAAAAKFYDLMSPAEIAALPVRDWLNPRSVVFLWATSPRLDVAMDTIRAWGLHYRGIAFVWVKTRKDGLTPVGAQGVRPSIVKPTTEYVIAASATASGRPLPVRDEAVAQVVLAPKGEHSQKPEEVQSRIERLYPSASKAELFARRHRAGWSCYGDQLAATA